MMWSMFRQSGSGRRIDPGIAVVIVMAFVAGPLCADEPSGTPTLYDGRTLVEWRERIKTIDYTGPDIAQDVPGLLAICQDSGAPWFSRRQAALTLGRIGEPAQSAVPVLVEFLEERGDNPEQSTQLWAIKSLALFGPLAGEAAPELVELLEDESVAPLPRLAAIEALGRIGPAQPEVLPAISRALRAGLSPSGTDDADTMERAVAAAEMLELFRGQAASTTPALIRATLSPNVLLRRAAANTLGLIGPSAAPALPALADLVLFDDVAEVRDLAARAMGRIGSAAEPILIQLLQDADPEVRRRVATACRELGRAAPETVAAIEEAAAQEAPLVRIAAIESLWAVTEDADRVVPLALAEMAHDDRQVRIRAVRLLESVGPKLNGWLPELRDLAADERTDVARAAQRVLRTVASELD